MASGRQVEYSLKLNSNASSVLMADAQAANKFDNSMWQVQKTLASFGLGLGAHYLIDAAKDWTQAAADYEQAMLRIKNVSGEGLGVINQNFINSQVDNFKLKLQESADAYGNFLFKIKNAHLSNDVSNRLFENLNVVSKVAGIPQEQMDATIRNLGIMLGEGVLEARHLRMLSYVHPQIVPYLAEALGLKSGQIDVFNSILHGEDNDETAQQKLSLLISSGKLTKLALNSNVLIEAFEKYREAIEGKLPETLTLLQSQLNDLSNTWLRFKNSFVLGDKPELLEFFNSLKNSIHWLGEHEEGIIRTAKSILNIAEAYAVWRLSLLAVSALNGGVLGFFVNEQNRLNEAFGVTNKVTTENISLNEKLVESESEVTYASSNLYDSYVKQLEIREANAYSIAKEFSELEKLEISLEQVSVQMDLFPQQGNLFTDTQLEMAASIKTTTDALALQNQQLEIQSRLNLENSAAMKAYSLSNSALLAEQQAALDAEGSAADAEIAGSIGYNAGKNKSLSGLGAGIGLLSDAVVPVMITWIANDVLNAMFPTDKNQWGYKDRTQAFGINLSSADYNDSYEDMIKAGFIDVNHPKFNGIAYADPQWLDSAAYQNYLHPREYSDTTGSQWNPYTYMNGDIGVTSPGNVKKDVTPNIKKLSGLEDHKLLGNSSNYFTVHIDTLNGIQKVDIKEASKNEIENIKAEVGVQIARNLTEIINDVQLIRNGH